jgi:hypothetical protein
MPDGSTGTEELNPGHASSIVHLHAAGALVLDRYRIQRVLCCLPRHGGLGDFDISQAALCIAV